MKKRVCIPTPGGDCPGVNATIRGGAKALFARMGYNVEIGGILYGYHGPITGVHGTHMIPKGLPGAGNILIFDNGGPLEDDLYKDSQGHAWSRIIEFDPITRKIVWEYSAPAEKVSGSQFGYRFFFSPFISIAQRLPNGNTMITEGSHGRVFEVTPDHELVWEYVCPYWGTALNMNMVYRAYRLPYEWVPQLEKPVETPIERLDVTTFRVPGAAAPGVRTVRRT